MKDQYIEFKKQRELGDILSDTFAFLRIQFKPFLTTFLRIVGPYLLAMLISYGFYFYSFSNILNFSKAPTEGSFNPLLMGSSLFALFITAIATYVMAQSTTLYYIKSYANNNGVIHFEEIKKEVYGSFWSFIGLGFLVGLALMAGFILCFIPGIYLFVPLSLSFSILVFNRKSATDAFSYSFTLVKDHWWITFASLFVIGIIVAVAGYAFSLPAVVYGWLKMGIFSGQMDAETMMDGFFDPIYILLSVLSILFRFVLNLISIVAGVLIYFNLNEKKNFTGTYERIQNIGEESEN